MYYTIEGKRVLGMLYIAGLITGTLFFNITMKMQIFKLSDFLDFTEYMKMLENIDLSTFCSYVFFVRFRQLILFFIGLFLFSPYIVFCLLDYITSIFIGILLSALEKQVLIFSCFSLTLFNARGKSISKENCFGIFSVCSVITFLQLSMVAVRDELSFSKDIIWEERLSFSERRISFFILNRS